ncbi:ankyrin repeat-containing domain protein [Schizophyllum amplum]|uniref:Ankyrin repeat-containing domain protein n=1 Tax=Schizophyllum amplum TaxID=97359 RepID=A0A550CSA7_9AGAR|nr:ankyrin repeat-containing domain protein [Auriculariopsis ampla]
MAEKDASARLRRAVKENNLFLVRRLSSRTDIRNPDPDHKRFTSLAWAAVLGHEETFEFLLVSDHDEDEISKDSDNNTILMLLANQDLNVGSPYVEPPADSGAAIRMARMYYDRYPDTLDWANADGKTALHFAAEKGNEELVRMLCDLGADFDLADNQGNTPLHYASSWGHIPVVQLLIERGCQFSARNNQGFTASDYAYSFSTRETLQETARHQFELNKKSRRAVYQQHTPRNTDYNAPPPPPPSKPREIRQRAQSRMRSGSGTSRTTTTSDSGDMESLGVSQHSQSSISASSSPSQPLGSHMQQRPVQRSANSSSNGTQSFSTVGSSRHAQPTNSSSALSPIATRMRERDADAMEKYLNRNRSGSNGTASTDAPRSYQSSTGLSAASDHLPPITQLSLGGPTATRRLRPSMSAAQLRSPRSDLTPTVNENRNRSGTSPSQMRQVPPLSHSLTRSSSTSNSLRGPFRPAGGSVFEEPESYTGPSIQYAQFPEPPLTPEDNATPTIASMTLGAAAAGSRRHALHNILTKPLASLDRLDNANHRRGMSASSLRG